VRLDLAKGKLARYLGTAPETLSRAFGRLAAMDLVAVDGRKVTFRNAQGLQTLAAGLAPETKEQ
jgi:Mn-dependent DtxR family transcriptional regulator